MQLSRSGSARQRGFSIIEFMIAGTVSLIMLAALSMAFVGSSRARDELQRANQQIENGRYAIQQLTDDLQVAGFYSQFDIGLAQMADPATKPNPCAIDLPSLRAALPLHLQGYHQGASGTPPVITCISDVRPNTDVLVERRVSTCIMGTVDCAYVTGAPYFQSSSCSSSTELDAVPKNGGAEWYRLDTNIGNLNRHLRDCTTLAAIRQYLVRIYYVANNNQAGDGIPTLKRVDLGPGAGGALAFGEPISVAEGIESVHLEYGLDTDGDAVPNVFADPDTYPAAADCASNAQCVANWESVLTVRIGILSRATTPSPEYTDNKSYTLGQANPVTFPPFGDRYKRHAYATSVRLPNPAGRRVS